MKIQYKAGITEAQILLCSAQIGAIQRMLQSEPEVFSLKDIQVLLGRYQAYIFNYLDVCDSLYQGITVNLIP
jgi:hypothetical protein